mmetsp:Transcript_31952/g.85324  ORF Transcript_31952/g.85324 Transcript_31952/m.85324 type:complete len:251 (-) Transcript_31952:260-1012(-)
MRKPTAQKMVRFGSSWELHPRHGQEETDVILTFAAKKMESGDALKHFVGQLSPEANEALLKTLLVKTRVGEAVKSGRLFKSLDSNNDGFISKEEFAQLVQVAKEEGARPVPQPTNRQLFIVMATSSVPFIGFGFMDNSIMILAGEVIEVNIGSIFSLTTMGAAATGNMLSDVAGVCLGSYVELVARSMGFTSGHGLTPEQMELKVTRIAGSVGAALGVSLGCLLGMFPLLWAKKEDDEDDDDDKKKKKKD